MSVTLLVAAAALAQAQPGTEVEVLRQGDRASVGYSELMEGRPHDAISAIEANRQLSSDDPMRLINMGTAHARLGHARQARNYYIAALTSRERYDVEIAGGQWLDSRAAARAAIAGMKTGHQIVLR